MQLKKIIKTIINNNISFHYERFLLKKKTKLIIFAGKVEHLKEKKNQIATSL